jgi:hypothetical protein
MKGDARPAQCAQLVQRLGRLLHGLSCIEIAANRNEVVSRPAVHARFRAVVARAIVKADRAHAEHLARLRPRRVREKRRRGAPEIAAPLGKSRPRSAQAPAPRQNR